MPLALALIGGGCASEPAPRYPDLGDSTTPLPQSVASNALAAANSHSPPAPTGPPAPTPSPKQPDEAVAGDTGALDNKRVLAIGDHLSFRILEDKDDPRQLVVTDSGDIEVPYVGRHAAMGRTCKQLATELKQELEAKYYYHATVIVSVDARSRNLGRVYASGALRSPGPLEIPGDEVFTLSKAVLRAGGFSDFADKHSVTVTRKSVATGTNETFTVDVGSILEKGRTALDLTLQPGDMFFVADRGIHF